MLGVEGRCGGCMGGEGSEGCLVRMFDPYVWSVCLVLVRVLDSLCLIRMFDSYVWSVCLMSIRGERR